MEIPKIKSMIPNIPIYDKNEAFYASAYYERLVNYIVEFEAELKDDEEVGARLVNFGEGITIHIDDIGYNNPSLICFYGRDSKEQEVQLIQNVGQISILLIKVKRTDLGRERVGYKLSQKVEE
jgi:hypothetical protein